MRTTAYQILTMLFSFGYGFYSLLYRPITQRLGKRFERYEMILGAVLLLSAIATALGIFIAGYV